MTLLISVLVAGLLFMAGGSNSTYSDPVEHGGPVPGCSPNPCAPHEPAPPIIVD